MRNKNLSQNALKFYINLKICEKKMSDSEDAREFGKVKWFSPRRGYGFIIRDNIPPDQENHEIFCHYSSIEMDGFKTLLPELRVSFEVAPGKRDGSVEAKNVKIAPPIFDQEEKEEEKSE